jgi:rhodanese-related sulfurtransferase
MKIIQQARIAAIAAITLGSVFAASPHAQRLPPNVSNLPSIFDGIVKRPADSPEINTAEFRKALDDASAIILDARPYEEYAVSHIPGALTVPGKPGTTPALYVGDVSDIVKRFSDKAQPLIVYCNGLFCGRSERFAEELIKTGYSNVRRYQLGAPGWRALGGVMQVEKPALLRLVTQDKTAVLIDPTAEPGPKPRLRDAISIPLHDAAKAKDDGRLPMTDHNTRIFVVGDNGAEARAVAEAIVHDAFHNVAFFNVPITDLPELLERDP